MSYFVRILNNNRILVRNNTSNTSEVIKATEVSDYFLKELESQIKAQEEEDKRQTDIRKKVMGSNEDI